jgi:5-methylcytosine-specific restriction endonuclease McrA
MAQDTTVNYARLIGRILEDERRTKETRKERKARTYYSKQEVLERDESRCLVCGFSECVDVHHIVSLANGGNSFPENLISLCPNHHRLADRGKIPANDLRRLVLARYEDRLDGILPTLDMTGKALG